MDPRAPKNRILQYYNPNHANRQAAVQNVEVVREEARPADANQALAIIHSDCIPVLVPVEWREVNFEQISNEPDLFYRNKRREIITLYYVAPNENVNGEAVEHVRFVVERMITVYVAVPNDNEAKQQQDKGWRVPPWLVKIVKSLNEEQFLDIIDETKKTEFLEGKKKVESKNCTRLECFHHEYVTAYYARYLDDDVDWAQFNKNLEKIHREIKCECNRRKENLLQTTPFVQNPPDELTEGKEGKQVAEVEVEGKVQEAQVVQEKEIEEEIPQENLTDANNYAQKKIGEVSDISGPIAAVDEIGKNKFVIEIVAQNSAPVDNNNLIAQANPIDELFDSDLKNRKNIENIIESEEVGNNEIQEGDQNDNQIAQNENEDNKSGDANVLEDQSVKMDQTGQDKADQCAPNVGQNSLNGNSDEVNDKLQERNNGFDLKLHSNNDHEDEKNLASKSENSKDSFDKSSPANEESDKVEKVNFDPKPKISMGILDSPPQSNENSDNDEHEAPVPMGKILMNSSDIEIDKSKAENGGGFESPPRSSDESDYDEIQERKLSNDKSQSSVFDDEDSASIDNDLSNEYNAGESPQSPIPNDEDMEVDENEGDSLPPPVDDEDVPFKQAKQPVSVDNKNPTESDVPDDDSHEQSEPDAKADTDDKSDSNTATESYNEADSDDDTIEDEPAGQANLNVESVDKQVIKDGNSLQNNNVPVVNQGQMLRGFNQKRAQKRKAESDLEHKNAKRQNNGAAQANTVTKEDWGCKQIVYQEQDDVVMKWDPKEWEGEPTRTTMDKINKAPEVLRMHKETYDHYLDVWVSAMQKATNYQNELERIRLMASGYNFRTSTDPFYHSFIERFFQVLKQSDEKYRIKMPTFAHVPELHRWHVYNYMRYLRCRNGKEPKVNGSSPSYGYEHFKTICEQIGNKESIEDFPTE